MGNYRIDGRRLDALYDHIVAYKRAHGGRCPSRRELSEALDFGSTAMVQAYLQRLEADGRIDLAAFGRCREIVIPGERWLAPEGRGNVKGELLNINEIAAEAGVTRRAVERAIRDGRLTPSARVGCRHRFARADVDAWLARRRAGRDRKPRAERTRPERADLLYDFIVAYKREHGGRCPTLREISAEMGWRSTSAAHHWLRRLEADGRIGLEDGGSRGIVIPGERWLAPGECVEGYSG
jgi:excisionase family DNA binding protein